MTEALQRVTESVLQRARVQGYILPTEVREELTVAGLGEEHWKDVLALARASLRYEEGRYWYQEPLSGRAVQEKERLDEVVLAVRAIIDQQRNQAIERRGQERIDVIHPVVLIGEDGREHQVLSRDLSVTGVRLIGTQSLLGQKVRLCWSASKSQTPWIFQVQILWTCAVGDDLFENGGAFVRLET